jgi:diacylglycerol kinase family enzyme
MRLTLILNREAGTLRGIDAEKAASDIADIFRARGHEVAAELLDGKASVEAIARACGDTGCEALVVGGGDGTISFAAAAAAKNARTLGILPLGTMNLFARSLGLPLEMRAAAEAIAGGAVAPVDIGEVNGRYFVHHVTLGLHARMILLRARMSYASRLGKLWASVKAGWTAIRNPPTLVARIRADGKVFHRRTAAILVTNNPLGEGHLPYADDPRQGMLGLYVARSPRLIDLLRLAAGMMLGKFSANQFLDDWVAREVDVAVPSPTLAASIDGEIVQLETPLRCRLHRGGLRVLRPGEGFGATTSPR